MQSRGIPGEGLTRFQAVTYVGHTHAKKRKSAKFFRGDFTSHVAPRTIFCVISFSCKSCSVLVQ